MNTSSNLNGVEPIVFFDGVCNLCNKMVQLIIKYDSNRVFKFCSLQSNLGRQMIQNYNLLNVDSIILYDAGKIYLKSEAVFQIVKRIPSFKFLKYLNFLPKSFVDYIYDIIAKYRYRIFGKSKDCLLPSENLITRFIS